jgi:uncharacterized protein YjbJ (UPF0337 family)
MSKIDHFHKRSTRNVLIRSPLILPSQKLGIFTARRPQMDKDRIKGSAQQAKGTVKEVVGKVTGDTKLESEGKGDKVAGKIQNAVGGLKDTLRGK